MQHVLFLTNTILFYMDSFMLATRNDPMLFKDNWSLKNLGKYYVCNEVTIKYQKTVKINCSVLSAHQKQEENSLCANNQKWQEVEFSFMNLYVVN